MARIDENIHFVWVGGPLPKDKAEMIWDHVFGNGHHYKIVLWTDRPQEAFDVLKPLFDQDRISKQPLVFNGKPLTFIVGSVGKEPEFNPGSRKKKPRRGFFAKKRTVIAKKTNSTHM